MQSVPVNVVRAADLCCYDSAASDTMLTPDARAVLGEVGGNNNSDTRSRHSSDSDLGASTPLPPPAQILTPGAPEIFIYV